jgi:hypothetical protein
MTQIRIIEQFDASFNLTSAEQEALFALLKGDAFLSQISAQLQGKTVEFTERLFQPIPYSSATPKGMPAEFEPYHHSEAYIIINVPPNFMFQAKIFKPSRLCAIYRLVESES